MSSIIVLGPRQWRPEQAPHVPAWISSAVPPWWSRQGDPVLWPADIRAVVVEELRQAGHESTMMELWTRNPQETDTELFDRVVRESSVRRFLLYWPYGGHVEGVTWELRGLVDSVLRRKLDPSAVRILAEEGVVSLDENSGELVLGEAGHRTTYYRDILRLGFWVVPWATYEELIAFARAQASD